MPGIEVSKKIVMINSASSAVSLLLNLSVLVWLQQYLLKRISPEEYSLIPLVMAILAFTPLLTIVLTSGLGRFITIAYARENNKEITRICSTMFPILVVAALAFLSIGWFGAWHIDKILEIPEGLVQDARIMMALLIFLAAIRLPLAVFGSGFIVRQKLLLQDIIDTGCQFFRIALLFLLLLGLGPKALWVTVAMVASELLNLVIITPISILLVPAQKIGRGNFTWVLAKEITQFGSWGFVIQLAETLKNTVDPIILNRFASAVDISVYHVAGIVPRQLQQMLAPIARPFIPILAALYATGDFTRLRNTYLRTARYNAWVLLFFSIPVLVFNKELMDLYLGGRYSDTGPIMALLLVIAILRSFNALGFAVIAAAGVLKGLGLRTVVMQILQLALTVFFVVVLRKGAFGSALAGFLTCILFEVTIIWPFCRKTAHTPTSLWVREVLQCTILPTLPSLMFCIVFKTLVVVDTWFTLFLASAVSGLLYFCFVLAFGLRQQDRIDLTRLSEKVNGPLKIVLKYLGKA